MCEWFGYVGEYEFEWLCEEIICWADMFVCGFVLCYCVYVVRDIGHGNWHGYGIFY